MFQTVPKMGETYHLYSEIAFFGQMKENVEKRSKPSHNTSDWTANMAKQFKQTQFYILKYLNQPGVLNIKEQLQLVIGSCYIELG